MYLKFILNKALLSNNELFTENNLQLILIKKLIKQRALKNEVSSIILKINMLYNKSIFIYSKIKWELEVKRVFVLPLILEKLNLEIPTSTGKVDDPHINFVFGVLILSIIFLLNFIIVVGYLSSICLYKNYNIKTKFPKLNKIIRYFERSSIFFVNFKGLTCVFFLLFLIVFYLFKLNNSHLVQPYGTGEKNKFLDDNSLFNLYDSYKEFLSTLSLDQLCSLSNLLISLLILSFLINIIVIYYGDVLIKYLSLEEKYPKLAKYIGIRRKILNISMFNNFVLIFILLIIAIVVNVTYLFF